MWQVSPKTEKLAAAFNTLKSWCLASGNCRKNVWALSLLAQGPKAGPFPSFESPDVWSHPIPCRLCLKPASSHGSASLSRDPLLNISDNNQHSWHCFPNSCLGARPSAGTWSAFPVHAVSALPNIWFSLTSLSSLLHLLLMAFREPQKGERKRPQRKRKKLVLMITSRKERGFGS